MCGGRERDSEDKVKGGATKEAPSEQTEGMLQPVMVGADAGADAKTSKDGGSAAVGGGGKSRAEDCEGNGDVDGDWCVAWKESEASGAEDTGTAADVLGAREAEGSSMRSRRRAGAGRCGAEDGGRAAEAAGEKGEGEGGERDAAKAGSSRAIECAGRAVSGGGALRAGWLKKLPGRSGWGRGPQARWCELRAGELRYWRKAGEGKGTAVPLTGETGLCVAGSVGGAGRVLVVRTAARAYEFTHEDEGELAAWLGVAQRAALFASQPILQSNDVSCPSLPKSGLFRIEAMRDSDRQSIAVMHERLGVGSAVGPSAASLVPYLISEQVESSVVDSNAKQSFDSVPVADARGQVKHRIFGGRMRRWIGGAGAILPAAISPPQSPSVQSKFAAPDTCRSLT